MTIPRKQFLQLGTATVLGSLFVPSIFTRGASAQLTNDFAVPGGWFYSQANGKGGGGDVGFTITNAEGIPFYDWFRRFGGPEIVGYPIGDRFAWNGFTVQPFQKVVFQWRPEVQGVYFVNVFDELSSAGRDEWLLTTKQVPKPNDWSSDTGKAWPQVVANHEALLAQNPAIRAVYMDSPDPLNLNGLPMSAQDFGNVYVVRAQRKVFQQWKVAVPWAAAGQVVVANGGDVGKEAGLFPAAAIVPKPPIGGSAPSVPVVPVAPVIPAPPVTQPAPTTKEFYAQGEAATQNGASLTLSNFSGDIGSLFNPRATLTVTFLFANNTGRALTVGLNTADFVAEAMGEEIPATMASPASFNVNTGAQAQAVVMFTMASANLSRFASVTEITVIVKRFSVVENVKWKVKVR